MFIKLMEIGKKSHQVRSNADGTSSTVGKELAKIIQLRSTSPLKQSPNKMIMKYCLLFVVIIILASCSKNVEPASPILEPLHYQFLPLYPNSYWIYENELGMQDTFYTKEYEIIKAICYGPPSWAQDSFKTTTLYRQPSLPNLSKVYGYTTYQCHANPHVSNPFGIVLSEVINDFWSVDRKDSRYSSTEQSKKTVLMNENVLEVKEFETAIQMGAVVNDSVVYLETYERDIGLTKRVRINTYSNDSITVLNLKEYNINN